MSLSKLTPREIVDVDRFLNRLIKLSAVQGLTVRQIWILVQTYKDVTTVRGMHEISGVDKSALTRGGFVLENLGFIERREEPGDRRSVEFHITKAGTRAVEQIAGL